MAGTETAQLEDDALLRVKDLVVEYPAGRGRTVHAVSGISLDVHPGETLGLVGESGCGKSTTGRAILQLEQPASGSVLFEGRELTRLDARELRKVRRHMQMVFQDPLSSLNPRRKIGDIVADPLRVWHDGTAEERRERVEQALADVGLDPDATVDRRPHEFSGGQCQRISIARCLVLSPTLLVCDEPVSALDVSVQAQIVNLLEDLKARYGLTLIFIAHDLAVVKNISDRVAVMYLGKLCEIGGADDLYAAPAHPYTDGLLASAPVPDPQLRVRPERREHAIRGEPPSALDPPSGCRFRTRCPHADERCASEEPVMRAVGPGHWVACHHPLRTLPSAPRSGDEGEARGVSSPGR